MKILFSDQPIDIIDNEPVIFLAGPTSRTNKYNESWRKEAVALLEELGFTGTVCIPEFSEPRNFEPDDWDKQTDWEWTLLDRSDCIVFWVPREDTKMPGLTTNLEFGTYLESKPKNVILGFPPEATHMQWMTKRYEYRTNMKPLNNLRDTLSAGVQVAEIQTAYRHFRKEFSGL